MFHDDRCVSAGEKPRVLDPLSGVTAVAPGDAVLECSVSAGKPPAALAWTREGRELRPGAKYEMTYVGSEARLVVRKLEPLDAGKYRLEAANKLGRVHTDGTLTVYSKCGTDALSLYKKLSCEQVMCLDNRRENLTSPMFVLHTRMLSTNR